MDNGIKDVIVARYERISRLAEQIAERLKHYPSGRIKIRRRGDYKYFYRSGLSGENDVYLGRKDTRLIEDLIRKGYLESVLKASLAESQLLKETIANYPQYLAEDVYGTLSADRRDLVKPIILPDDQFIAKWQSTSYTPKVFEENTPYYSTIRGERVRSKSEQIIADRLYAQKIPYKYECPLTLGDQVIHPDFTILRISDRTELYLEHCGRADDPNYTDGMVKRINLYSLSNIIIGNRLFLSFETSATPLDVRVIDNLIKTVFR